MLSTRLVVGFAMAGVLAAVLIADEWLAPWFPFWFVLTMTAMVVAANELVGLLLQTSAKPSGNTVVGGVVAIVCANWAPHLFQWWYQVPEFAGRMGYDPLFPVNSLAWPMLTFSAIVMATFIAQSAQFEKPGTTMATISATVLAVSYIGLLGSFVIQIRWFDGPHHGLIPLATLFTAAKGADTGAYTFGRIAGRHKLWPRLSPNKTIEGAFGGMVFAVGGALLVTAIGRYLIHDPVMSWRHAVAFGLVIGVAAQLGDLMESMIKRDCARKDASMVVPGFGGVLDVLDSLLFAGPAAFMFWMAVGT